MTKIEEFDLLVVGGGKAGKTLAMDLAKAGQRVAMVERGMIGGTCINVACIPTKTLVTSARALRTLRQARDLGMIADGHPDLNLLRAHKNGVVEGMVAGNRKMFLDSGMDLVIGTARFIGPRTANVELADGGARVLRGQEVVINTGTKPMLPPIPGLAEAAPLTSETMLELERIPERLIVLGGGYVGAEFARKWPGSAAGSRWWKPRTGCWPARTPSSATPSRRSSSGRASGFCPQALARRYVAMPAAPSLRLCPAGRRSSPTTSWSRSAVRR